MLLGLSPPVLPWNPLPEEFLSVSNQNATGKLFSSSYNVLPPFPTKPLVQSKPWLSALTSNLRWSEASTDAEKGVTEFRNFFKSSHLGRLLCLSTAASSAGIQTSWTGLHPPHQPLSVQTERRRESCFESLYNCTFITFFPKGTL